MSFTVYILQSLKDGGYYVGMTQDIAHRLTYHNKGYVCSTKIRVPFKIAHVEAYNTRKEARDREKYLKSYQGSKEKLMLLNK